MKTWKIPIAYEMMGVVSVEANTLREAIEIAKDQGRIIALPENSEHVPGTWCVAFEDEKIIRCLYNGSQDDE